MPISTIDPAAAATLRNGRFYGPRSVAARPAMSARVLEMLAVLNRALDDEPADVGSPSPAPSPA